MRNYWFWIVARDGDTGKVFLIAGGKTEEEARSKGLETLGGTDFVIKRLPTRNLQSASSMVRGARLEHGEGLMKASSRQGHDKSVARLRRKIQARRLHGGF